MSFPPVVVRAKALIWKCWVCERASDRYLGFLWTEVKFEIYHWELGPRELCSPARTKISSLPGVGGAEALVVVNVLISRGCLEV